MFGKDLVDQSSLDTMLLNLCTPEDGIIDLAKLEEILIEGANPNSLHPWTDFSNRYGEGQSRFPLLQRIANAKNASFAAQILLRHGADLTLVDPHTGNTVLHTAISISREDYLLFLIKKISSSDDPKIRALVGQKDTKHPDWLNTPLIFALKKGLENVVEALIDAGADVNETDRYGTFPLHWAAMLRYDAIIEKMLERGVCSHQHTRYNRTALELYQYEFGRLDFVRKLKLESSQIAGVTMGANFPELSDNHFHGFHRKKQAPNEKICKLLTTHSQGLPLSEQYIEKFITQDAIARSAICVIGYEYANVILRVLREEGERLYGKTVRLPDYAGSGIYQRRSNPPNYNATYAQIVNAIQAFKEQKENPQKTVSVDDCYSVCPTPILQKSSSQTTNEEKQSVMNFRPKPITQKGFRPSIKQMGRHTHFLTPNLTLVAQPASLSSSTSTLVMPAELEHILNDSGMVKDCLTKGFVSRERLIELHKEMPYVVDALRASNIYQAVAKNFISIEELSKLRPDQILSIKFKLEGTKLRDQVREYLSENQTLRYEVMGMAR